MSNQLECDNILELQDLYLSIFSLLAPTQTVSCTALYIFVYVRLEGSEIRLDFLQKLSNCISGRLQFVAQVREITFINDTTATTPSATLAALESLQGRPLIFITGGADKGLDFTDLGASLPVRTKAAVFLPGTATKRYQDALVDHAGWKSFDAATMQDAVQKAFALAQPGDMIVLSPACASFGLFKNEFDRGAQFDAAVQAIVSGNS